MMKVRIGILSIFFVVTFADNVRILICDDVDNLLFSERLFICRYREVLRRAFKLDKSFKFSNDRRYLSQIEAWTAFQKSINKPMPDHMKSKESPDLFNKKFKKDDFTSLKENISSVTYTSVDNTAISTTQQSSNVPHLRMNESFVITENINTDNSISSEENYSEKISFATSSTIFDTTKLEIQRMQSSISTIKEYNISTSIKYSSSSIPARPITYSTENISSTVTPGSHINKTVSVINATTAQNNTEISSYASSSFVNRSTANPAAVSVTNTEGISSDGPHTMSSSTYMESSSRESNPASSNPVIKSTKPDESITVVTEKKTRGITEAIPRSGKKPTKNISIRLIILATFLSIATIALVIILTYMIRFKRNDMQYDEVKLLP